MTEAFNQFISKFSKLAPAPLLAIGVATSIILFSSEDVATLLGIEIYRKDNRGLIGSVFIVSWSYLAAYLVWEVKGYISLKIKSWKAEKTRAEYLCNLTTDEKRYLSPYVKERINTQHFEPEDGVIGGLALKGIVYQGSHVYDILEGVGWNIQPWARTYLEKHPEQLSDNDI